MLDSTTLAPYLRGRGLVPRDTCVVVTPLAGGISNIVLRAEWPGRAIVVKQSLPRLNVRADWQFDRSRIFVERACIDTLAELLPGTAPATVFADDDRFVLGITCLPAGGVVWKDAHMAGVLDSSRTENAATLLGCLQRDTAGSSNLAARFDDLMPLVRGRIDPYHRTAARANPDVADLIDAEVRRMMQTRGVLVHGDYSPKNLVAYPDRMMMLDFEVAHWGDPAFDPAFLLSHLVLGSCYHKHLTQDFIDEAVRFWRTYRAVSGPLADEAAVVRELACLLLARVDGKSPVEYITGTVDRQAIRRYAKDLLRDDTCREIDAALARARQLRSEVAR